MNTKLAIAIPTYNRSEIVRNNLLSMIEEIKEYNIPIYISDDSDNLKTQMMVKDLKKEYEFIFYKRNETEKGFDNNCFKTLQLPKSEYVWLLTDSMGIKKGGIAKVLKIISENEYDFVAVNDQTGNLKMPSKYYTNANDIFRDLGWYLTQTASTIYNSKLLNDFTEIENKYYKNFPQVTIIFNKLLSSKQRFYWLENKLIYANKNKKSYWSSEVFDVFITDWSKLVLDLPEVYSKNDKLTVIKNHDKYTKLFSIKNILKYRLKNIFNIYVFIKNYKYLRIASDTNILILFILSITPIPMRKNLDKYITNKLEKKKHYAKHI